MKDQKDYGRASEVETDEAGARVADTGHNLKATIETFRALEPDWDSYGACPTTDIAITVALEHAESFGPGVPAYVFPTVNGGVQFEVHAEGFDFEIEFDERGLLDGWLFDAATREQTADGNTPATRGEDVSPTDKPKPTKTKPENFAEGEAG